jgi:hypothetical protein
MSDNALPVGEWCKQHRLSMTTFRKLLKLSKAPRTMAVGAKTYVSPAATAAWYAAMEAEPSTHNRGKAAAAANKAAARKKPGG